MKKFKFNKPLVESPYPPLNTHVLWVDVKESDNTISDIKEYYSKTGWKSILVQPEVPEDINSYLYYYSADGSQVTPYSSTLTDSIKTNTYDSKGLLKFTTPIVSLPTASFYNANLSYVTLPETVTEILPGAFYDVDNLQSVYISKNITNYQQGYYKCDNITSIQVDASNPVYDSRENCNAIIETATNTAKLICNSTVLPASVTSIASNAYTSTKPLELTTYYPSLAISKLNIPNTTKLTINYCGTDSWDYYKVSIPYDLKLNGLLVTEVKTSMPYAKYEYISSIKTLTLTGGETSQIKLHPNMETLVIDGNYTVLDKMYVGRLEGFLTNNIKKIIISENVTNIDAIFWEALWDVELIEVNSDVDLTELFKYCLITRDNFINNANVDTSKYSFIDSDENGILIKDNVCVGFRSYVSDIIIPEGVTEININSQRWHYEETGSWGDVYHHYKSVTVNKFVIPSTVTQIQWWYSIGGYVKCREFINNSTATLPSEVSIIEDSPSLSDFVIEGDTLTKVNSQESILIFPDVQHLADRLMANEPNWDLVTASGDYVNVTAVVLPSTLKEIPTDAFYYCTALETINIPNSVTSIGEEAFRGCDSLNSIIIPDNITNINYGVFKGCTSLDITIPKSIKSIGGDNFYKTVHYLGTLEDWMKIDMSMQPSLYSLDIKGVDVNNVIISTESIPNYCFNRTESFKSIKFLGKRIGEGAFSGASITKIDMPNIEIIESGALNVEEPLDEVHILTEGVHIHSGGIHASVIYLPKDISNVSDSMLGGRYTSKYTIVYNGTKEEFTSYNKYFAPLYANMMDVFILCTDGELIQRNYA